jgi:transposase-like protein
MGKKRTFSPEERLSILQEGQREGQTATCRKYNIAPSLYQQWKKKYLEKGVEGLKRKNIFIVVQKILMNQKNCLIYMRFK